MKVKRYLFIILLVFVLIGVSESVSALKIEKLEDTSIIILNGKSIITTHITPTDSLSDSKKRKELNKINIIVVQINGKTVNIIKKGKGWIKYDSYSKYSSPAIIDRSSVIKKNLKEGKLGIFVFNKKNKLIISKISTIKPSHISKVKITKKKAIEIAKNMEISSAKVKKAVLKKGNLYTPYYWKITFIYPKPGKLKPGEIMEDNKVDGIYPYVYIDAITGKALSPADPY